MPTGVGGTDVGGVGALPMLATVRDVAAEQIDVIHLLLLLGALLTMVLLPPPLLPPPGLIICVCWSERRDGEECLLFEWTSCFMNQDGGNYLKLRSFLKMN